MNEKPQQIVVIEHSKSEFDSRFYELREGGYRATQVSVACLPATHSDTPDCVFMALMEF